MEHNKELYEHLFQAIRKQLESGLARTEGNDAFNIFKVLGIADKEVLICRLLGELLDPKGSHGLGAKPLSLFLERLRIADRFSPGQVAKARVVLEETIDRDRRIDLVLYLGNEVIPLEVKVWAGDQNKQLYDYYHYFAQTRQRNGTFKIYYLTPNGRSPSEISICDPAANQRLTSEQYQCVSFREDVDNWIRRILADCSPRVGVILQQFQEVISDMCSEDIQLQNIREAIHLQEGRFERNGNLEALLHILTANRTNGLWRMIRKEYLRAACTFDKNKYQLVDVSEEEKRHEIFAVHALATGKRIAWICVDTNLYITAEALKPEFEKQPEWVKENGYVWRYISPNGGSKQFPLKEPTTRIMIDDTLEIGELLDQILS